MFKKLSEKDDANGLSCHFCSKPATYQIAAGNCSTCNSEIRVCDDHLFDVGTSAFSANGLKAYFLSGLNAREIEIVLDALDCLQGDGDIRAPYDHEVAALLKKIKGETTT